MDPPPGYSFCQTSVFARLQFQSTKMWMMKNSLVLLVGIKSTALWFLRSTYTTIISSKKVPIGHKRRFSITHTDTAVSCKSSYSPLSGRIFEFTKIKTYIQYLIVISFFCIHLVLFYIRLDSHLLLRFGNFGSF